MLGAQKASYVGHISCRRALCRPVYSTLSRVSATGISALLLSLLASQLVNLRGAVHMGDGGGELQLLAAAHSQVT